MGGEERTTRAQPAVLRESAVLNEKLSQQDDRKNIFRRTVDHNLRRIEQRLTNVTAPPTQTTEKKTPAGMLAQPGKDKPREAVPMGRREWKRKHSSQVTWSQDVKETGTKPQIVNSASHYNDALSHEPSVTSNIPNLGVNSRMFVMQSVPSPTLVVTCPFDKVPHTVKVCHHMTRTCDSDISLCTECEPSFVSSECSCYRNQPTRNTAQQLTCRQNGLFVYTQTKSPIRAYIGGLCRRLSPSMSKYFTQKPVELKAILHSAKQPVLHQPETSVNFTAHRKSSDRRFTDSSSVNSSMWRALMCGACFEMAGEDDGESSVNSESDGDGDDGSDGGGDGDDGEVDADNGDSASDIEAIEYSSDGGGSSGGSSISNDGSLYQDELMNEEMYHHDMGYDEEQDELDYLYRDHQSYNDDTFDGYSYADEEERIRGYCGTHGMHDPLGDAVGDRRLEFISGSEECGERCEFYADEFL